jgi:hypothetical protein
MNRTIRPDQIIRTTDDPLMLKYDDENLAKIAQFIGQDSLDQVLSGFKSKESFTIGEVLKRLGIKSSEIDVDATSVLGKE